MKYAPEWYPSPIDLPAATSGKVAVRHRNLPVGASVTIVGGRQAFLRGQAPVKGVVEGRPLRVHELYEEGEDGGVWMTDLPEELNQIAELLYTLRPRGRVLVGGLGLGVLASQVAAFPGVTETVVVERSPDVIALCARPGYRVVEADVGAYLAEHQGAFDYYLLDTWRGTNEGTWFEDVLPLRRTIRRRWGRRPIVHCWAEDIMQGQLLRSLTHTVPHWYYTYLPVPMPLPAARRFLRDVGLPAWERRYGAAIDRYVNERGDDA